MSQDAENVRGGLTVGHLGEGLGHLVKGCGEFTASLRVDARELVEQRRRRGRRIGGHVVLRWRELVVHRQARE